MDPKIKNILLKTKPFKYLIEDELEILIQYCKIISFPKNEVIFKQGKAGEHMYVLISGKASAYIQVLGKKIIQFVTLEQGNFIGEVNMIEKSPCIATVIADEETNCLQLPSAYFDMLYTFFPEIHYKITRAITEEVCLRIYNLYTEITMLIQKFELRKFSILSQFIQFYEKPKIINFDQIKLNTDELKHAKFFKRFRIDDIDELISYMSLIKVPNQYALINENETVSSAYVILRGAIQSSIITDNKFAKLSVFGPMNLIASNTIIDGNPSFISYTTCERSVLLMLSKENILRLQSNFLLWHPFYYAICYSFISLERACDKLLVRLNSEIYNR